MSARTELLDSIAQTIADYREGEVEPRTPDIIENWIEQFPPDTQTPLLTALNDVFKKTYFTRNKFKHFLQSLASTDKLSPGSAPAEYWKDVNFLDIQQGGSSQKDILLMFDEVLQEIHGFKLSDTGSDGGDFIYLDDCIGTGSRVRGDICTWLEDNTPDQMEIHIITPILHTGAWWVEGKIKETAIANNKEISLHYWRLDEFYMENRLAHRDHSDVLWPTTLPDHADVQSYAKYLEENGNPVRLRNPGNSGSSGIFTSDEQKMFIEQALLIRGCQIKREYDNLPDNARPLGFHNLDCLGFGSMFITYRNCPNNCPLSFWVEQDEYPALFPRKTNAQTLANIFLRGSQE